MGSRRTTLMIKSGTSKKVPEYTGVYQGILTSKASVIGLRFFGRKEYQGTRYQSKYYETAREAALWYDKKLLELGLRPVNILKPKIKE